jgi:hypothetical protein
MLTAQKENKHLTLVQRPPILRSFETVVHSIEGLRERVQGFTVEQLSETEQMLQTMSLRLGDLQQTVSAVSEIKRRLNSIQQMLPDAQVATVDESTLASVDSFTPLHSLPHFGNIAKFRRIIKLVRAVKSVSVLLAPSDRKDPALILDMETNAESPKLDRIVATLTSIEHPFLEPVENSAIVDTAGEGTEGSEHSQDSQSLAIETDVVRTEPNCDESFDIISAKEATSSWNFSETIDESFEATEDRAGGDPAMVDSTAGGQPHTAVCTGPDFDRRLLDDLIQNYGEFNVMPNLPATTKAKKEVKSEAPASKRTADLTTAAHSASHRNLPTQRKDGELDRKLKKLIKDYGEYDLYSRQSPFNLKTSVIAAFLVLTLFFLGFYYFSSNSAAPAPNISSGVQSPDKEMTPGNGETLSTGSTSSLEVPKPREGGSSRNLTNNIGTKNTR